MSSDNSHHASLPLQKNVHWEIRGNATLTVGAEGLQERPRTGLLLPQKASGNSQRKLNKCLSSEECYNKQIRTFQLQSQAAMWSSSQLTWTRMVNPDASLGAFVVQEWSAKLGLAEKRRMRYEDHQPQQPAYPSPSTPRGNFAYTFPLNSTIFSSL